MAASKRFLVINRRVAIIGLDVESIPCDQPDALHPADMAWTAPDLDRVQECIVEFDAIYATCGQ